MDPLDKGNLNHTEVPVGNDHADFQSVSVADSASMFPPILQNMLAKIPMSTHATTLPANSNQTQMLSSLQSPQSQHITSNQYHQLPFKTNPSMIYNVMQSPYIPQTQQSPVSYSQSAFSSPSPYIPQTQQSPVSHSQSTFSSPTDFATSPYVQHSSNVGYLLSPVATANTVSSDTVESFPQPNTRTYSYKDIEETFIYDDEDYSINTTRLKKRRGKIAIEYIEDADKRRVSFCKRSEPLLARAKELHTLTRCQIQIQIRNVDSQDYKEYNSRPFGKANKCIQKGQSYIDNNTIISQDRTPSKRKNYGSSTITSMEGDNRESSCHQGPSSSALENTPRQAPLRSIQNIAAPIEKLPGKAKKKVQTRTVQTPTLKNKCQKCKVIYKSKSDNLLRKKYKFQNEWLGCEVKGCDFWVHLRCASLSGVKSKKELQNAPFRCPLHQKKK